MQRLRSRLALKTWTPSSFTNARTFNWHISVDCCFSWIYNAFIVLQDISLSDDEKLLNYHCFAVSTPPPFSSILYSFHQCHIFYSQCNFQFLLPLELFYFSVAVKYHTCMPSTLMFRKMCVLSHMLTFIYII
jgi:hypothetical protein